MRLAAIFFIVAMALHGSFTYSNAYLGSTSIDHRLIAALDSTGDFANTEWDDLVYIPRMNDAARGHIFSDPWNSHNLAYAGWGPFGLIPPIIGGTFIYVFGNYFAAMTAWSVVNFSLIALLLMWIFQGGPVRFTTQTSILTTFAVMSFFWLGSWPLHSFSLELLISIFMKGNSVSSDASIEAGLFTYLFYVIFIAAYFRYITASSNRTAVLTGIAAGFLSYVYFFHFVFAMAMLVSTWFIAALSRNRSGARSAIIAVVTGLIFTVPYLINTWVFNASVAPIWYPERLSFSPGRSPFGDYIWFVNLATILIVGFFYLAFRSANDTKSTMVRIWLAIALAYVLVLHTRVLLGYMQAPDHFWRQSLGIPATIWCVAAIADLVRGRMEIRHRVLRRGSQFICILAVLLPALIVARTAAKAYVHMEVRPTSQRLTDNQTALLRKMDCIASLLNAGEGFLNDEPALNYHVAANLKAKPFMALGLSPMTVEALTKRYLLSSHLVGKDAIPYPESPPRTKGYIHAIDPHLYLYINLFQNASMSDDVKDDVKSLYRNWNPRTLDWASWQPALASVKTVFVDRKNLTAAMPRLRRVFILEQTNRCAEGTAFRVTAKAQRPL